MIKDWIIDSEEYGVYKETPFFPVALHKVFFLDGMGAGSNASLMLNNSDYVGASKDDFKFCKDYYSIVRVADKNVFSIPSIRWEFISYEDSVLKANILAEVLFEKNSLMDLYKSATLPHDGAECIMQFCDLDYFKEFHLLKDWSTYLQIENNYKGHGNLVYTFGFRIDNEDINVVFEKLVLHQSVRHSQTSIMKLAEILHDSVQVEEQKEEFGRKVKIKRDITKKEIITKFHQKVRDLMMIPINGDDKISLLFSFLRVTASAKPHPSTKEMLRKIIKEFKSLRDYEDAQDLYDCMKLLGKYVGCSRYLSIYLNAQKAKQSSVEYEIDENEDRRSLIDSEVGEFLTRKERCKFERRIGNFFDSIIKEFSRSNGKRAIREYVSEYDDMLKAII